MSMTKPQSKQEASRTFRARAKKFALAGNHRAAAVSYALAAGVAPESDARLFQAIQLKHAGDVDEAEKAFQCFLESNPRHFEGWTSYATMLKGAERYAKAVEAFQSALAVRDDTNARNGLVTSLWRLGHHDVAIQEGRVNLERKDSLAFERFEASPFSKHALSDRRPEFDPSKRTRNIISFSLWGDDPAYVTGAVVNAQIAQHIYVGWTPRFYCDTSVPEDARIELQRLGAQVILLTDPALQKIRPMWRFLVSDDDQVDYFVCRDADSRLNVQELLAVHAWTQSDKRFHVMRDHIYHMELMLAGMWGGVAGVLPNMRDWLLGASDYFDNRFGDQAFLMNQVWPLVKQDLCTHDSVYGFPDGVDFPPGYRLPGAIHVGGAVKSMPHWRRER